MKDCTGNHKFILSLTDADATHIIIYLFCEKCGRSKKVRIKK